MNAPLSEKHTEPEASPIAGRDRGYRRVAGAWLLVFCLFAGVPCSPLRADSGSVILLPMGAGKPKNGLRLQIDTRWVDANGYRPVRVQAINWPPGPTPADRSFRLVLQPQTWRWGIETTTVTQYLEMPQGATRAETTVSIPQDMSWNSLSVEVYEDGVRLRDLCDSIGVPMRSGGYEWSEATPAVLIIDADAPGRDQRNTLVQQGRFGAARRTNPEKNLPDIRYLVYSFPNVNDPSAYGISGVGSEVTDLDTLMIVQDLQHVDILPPGELPEEWINYTCFDLICISRSDLEQLVAQHGDRWRAIREWLAGGPTLCVYDTPIDTDSLDELDRLLGLGPRQGRSGERVAEGVWRRPQASNADRVIRGFDRRDMPVPQGIVPGNWQGAAAGDGVPFVIREADLGRVVAIVSDEPFGSEAGRMNWLFNEIGRENWMWYQRHGMSMHRENADYWNLIIPGIGRAPVGSYLVLITLFVIVIGPVNYYWLRKRKRLYLLLVTVPLGAALVTVALLNYALLTDGLGVRVRVRSFTNLDQRNQRSVSWSRQSYYAGLAPSRGLEFPATAALYPIEQYPSDRRRRQGRDYRMTWDEGQHLTSGYVSSRSTSQFMIVNAAGSDRRLVVSRKAGDAAPTIQNRLGVAIQWLALRDSDGGLFGAQDVAPDQTVRLQPMETNSASTELSRLYFDLRPEFPEGYDARYYRNAFGFQRRYYSPWTNVDQNLAPPGFSQGVLERHLRLQSSTGLKSLAPGSYLAVTQQGVDVPLGYQRLREEASFHLVHGTW